ncbi:hypothetical protein BSL78_18220 [Apostichopus japonicus]|uniref:Fibrinogen C-terminal domain-containing protein n=1 Tax=Stichopus japonicus TaxID=307972 RepID=A0A2G8KA88_STIJA|nr:hypothetical protein BSL78_18220 [Apostichopus japonicus]
MPLTNTILVDRPTSNFANTTTFPLIRAQLQLTGTTIMVGVDGSVDFYADWYTYKYGFGFLSNEFWIGNEKLYFLTNQADYQLRIDLVNSLGSPYYANFDLFRISGEYDLYRLVELGEYSGDADLTNTGSAMHYHLGMPFTTYDRDNDWDWNFNCARLKLGAWWYKECYESNLNGRYYTPYPGEGITWYNLPGRRYHIKFSEMKIRHI